MTKKDPQLLLIDHLRSVTWHRHEALEKLPFVVALMNGTVPLESYIAQLRGFSVILATIDQILAQSNSSCFVQLRPFIKSRFEMISADLSYFAPRLVPDIIPAIRVSLDLATVIRKIAITNHYKFIGFLYVIQGTIKGNQVHLPDIKSCFGVDENGGASFYAGYGDATSIKWDEFRAIMNSIDEDGENLHAEALLGTNEMYDVFERFHGALFPFNKEMLGFTATAINPEAGDHSVPQNPKILEVSLKAARLCHSEFPYYELRYGERGRKFTDSDAAWLAALADQTPDIIMEQVLWLGRLLSARGMPFLLLERQLEILIKELEKLKSLHSSISTAGLKMAIANLKQERTRIISENDFNAICQKLLQCVVLPFDGLALIIVAAYIDKLSGMPECLSSLLLWLKESSLLTHEEILTVENNICR